MCGVSAARRHAAKIVLPDFMRHRRAFLAFSARSSLARRGVETRLRRESAGIGLAATLALAGCGAAPQVLSPPSAPVNRPLLTSVVPSTTGTPNSVTALGDFAFISVQGTGTIYSYNTASGTPVLVAAYATPCLYPSGMVTTSIGGANVMAVPCFDTGSLLTLSINRDGTLSALGSVSGLPSPFPGIAIDGTDVYVPLYGTTLVANGAVAKVSIATPSKPSVTAITTMTSPLPGAFANPSYLAVSGGYVYVAAGSESSPWNLSSTIQVLRESTMQLVGTPLMVDHSPQALAATLNYLFVTSFDAGTLASIDISDPANLKPVQSLVLDYKGVRCTALPIAVFELSVYVGCYGQSELVRYDIADPANMVALEALSGVENPQSLFYSVRSRYLFAVGSKTGGSFYQIDGGAF